jgi:hypothetical protein
LSSTERPRRETVTLARRREEREGRREERGGRREKGGERREKGEGRM